MASFFSLVFMLKVLKEAKYLELKTCIMSVNYWIKIGYFFANVCDVELKNALNLFFF